MGLGTRRVALPAAFAALTIAAALAAASAPAGRAERPADELTKYVASLRSAAKLADGAHRAAAELTGPNCAAFGPAAAGVAEAAASAESAFRAYRKANTRYGTQEEIQLIAALATNLREARGLLARAAGETGTPSPAEQQAAGREVSLFQSFVALKIEDRLEVEGLADFLTSRSFAELKSKVVSELQRRLRERAEAELRRLVGLRIKFGVPLKEQIRSFLEAELSRALSRLAVAAGPAGLVISVFGGRIVSLIGAQLAAALRHKGHVVERTNRAIAGFASLQEQLRRLPKDATLDRVRTVVRATERALNATAFLEGDIRRTGKPELAEELKAAEKKLRATLSVARVRFLLDSALFGEDFGIAIRYATGVRSDAARLAKKLGCPLATGGGTGVPPAKGVAPTGASCPSSFPMEAFSSLGAKTGEFTARFSKIEKTYPPSSFYFKCLYVSDSGGEVFVIFFELVPPDTPGKLPSGGCGSSRKDDYPFYRSRKRYLSVSGGERASFTRAVGGNDKILMAALALAEAQGVGQACPK